MCEKICRLSSGDCTILKKSHVFQIFHPAMQKKYETQLLTMDKYLNLYVPAVDWLLFGTLNANICKLTLLEELLQQCEDIENK